MAFAHYLLALPLSISKSPRTSIVMASSSSTHTTSTSVFSSSLRTNARKLSVLSRSFPRIVSKARENLEESEPSIGAYAFTQVKHVLLPVTDRNPYLSEGTKQAVATTAVLAKKYEAEITVVVIDENAKDSLPGHDTQISSIRWHLSEGGFKEFRLIERLGEGTKPTAIISEVADDLNLDLVVISMEAIHSKHVDANLLAEFIPCPVLLLPL